MLKIIYLIKNSLTNTNAINAYIKYVDNLEIFDTW